MLDARAAARADDVLVDPRDARDPALGYVRLADYAREWLGVSGREVQDLVIAGTRLERLPAVEAALRRGEIPWSKARLVVRVATAEAESATAGAVSAV